MPPLINKMLQCIEKSDRLGSNFGFVHRSSKAYKSKVGGILTLGTQFFLFGYLIVLINTALNHYQYATWNISKRLNLVLDQTEFPIKQENFDFGTKLHTYYPLK